MTSHVSHSQNRIVVAVLLLALSKLSPNLRAQPDVPSAGFGQNVRLDARSDLHGRQLLTGPGTNSSGFSRSAAYLWDLESGKELRRFEGHVHEMTAVAFMPDGKQVLTSAGRRALVEPAIGEPILLLDAETGREIRRFDGLENAVQQLEVSADGSRFLAVGYDQIARVWDTNTGKQLCVISRIYSPRISSTPYVRFDRSGTKLVGFLGGAPWRMRIWDASTGAELATIVCDSGQFQWLEFSPDGNRVLSGSSEGAVRIFDWKSGKEVQSFIGHTRNVNQASYLGDGQRIMTSSSDLSVRLWDVSTGKELMRLDDAGAVDRVRLSDDGKRLLTRWSRSDVGLRAREGNPSLRGVSLWNVESGELIKEFNYNGSMNFVGFLTGTQTILVERAGKPVQLIDGATGEVKREY